MNKEYIIVLNWYGLTSYKIAKILGIAQSTVSRQLAKLDLKPCGRRRCRKDKLKNHTQSIIKEYLSGKGCYLLAKKYKCSQNSILSILKQNSVHIRR